MKGIIGKCLTIQCGSLEKVLHSEFCLTFNYKILVAKDVCFANVLWDKHMSRN